MGKVSKAQVMETETEIKDLVVLKDGVPVTTSLKVAEVFGKEHKDVIKAIKNILKSDTSGNYEFGRRNFAPSNYLNLQGKSQPMFDITEEGTMLLIMGFTGEKALEFKLRFIEEFKRMKAFISEMKQKTEIDDDEIIARGYMLVMDKVKRLEAKIAEDGPKIDYHDKVLAESETLRTATEMAADLGLRSAQEFNKLMHKLGVQHKVGGVWVPCAKYADKGYMAPRGGYYPGADGKLHTRKDFGWTERGRKYSRGEIDKKRSERTMMLAMGMV